MDLPGDVDNFADRLGDCVCARRGVLLGDPPFHGRGEVGTTRIDAHLHRREKALHGWGGD